MKKNLLRQVRSDSVFNNLCIVLNVNQGDLKSLLLRIQVSFGKVSYVILFLQNYNILSVVSFLNQCKLETKKPNENKTFKCMWIK